MSQKIDITKILNNREMALVVWILIAILLIIINRKIRSSIFSLLKALFNKKYMWLLYIWMLLYTGLIIYVLQRINFWELYLIKDTVVWFVFSGVISTFRAIGDAEDLSYFKKIAKDYIKLFIVFQFFVNLYTFNFIIEFAIMPILFILAGLFVILEVYPEYQKEEYRPAKKILDFINVAVGLFIIFNSVSLALKNINDLGTVENFKTLIYPSILSLLFIMFNYTFALVSGYEQIFIRIRFGEKKSRFLIFYTKLKIFLLCRLSLKKVKTFWSDNGLKTLRVKNKVDVKRIIDSWK